MEIDRSVFRERAVEEHAFDVREPLRLLLGIAADKGPPAAADRPFIFGIDVEGHLRGERERRADRRAEGRVGARQGGVRIADAGADRSEEHTSELPSLMRTSYAVFCLKQNIAVFKDRNIRKQLSLGKVKRIRLTTPHKITLD